jgi:uracil-DNA glycosylase
MPGLALRRVTTVDTAREEQLAKLYREIRRDPRCRNERMGTVFVPGSGDVYSAVVLVGEAPGREEEVREQPFVGAAGDNLNTLLRHVQWARERLFITNLVKYRPFTAQGSNRKPSPQESRYALGYLLRELAILDPQWVVCLGISAASVLLGRPAMKMASVNGKEFLWQRKTLFITYHPSPLNYNNPHRRGEMLRAFERLRELAQLG